MSAMFSKPQSPSAQPLPESDSEEKAAARLAAERDAIAAAKVGGRGSTIVAGARISAEDQAARGMLAKRRRESSKVMLGD